jgi:hypothetical protein
VKRGELVKKPCEVCGSCHDIQGHHHKGYAKEHHLDVVWLCRTCHNKTHGKLGGFNTEDLNCLFYPARKAASST